MFMTSANFEHILLILLCIVTTNYFNIIIRSMVKVKRIQKYF